MATNPINQPFQPFHVQSSLLNDTSRRDGSGPQGPNSPRTPSGSGPWDPSGDFTAGAYGWLAALAFCAVYLVGQRYVQLAPLMIAMLIGCVLMRMGARERQFAAIPVALAGIKLALQVTSVFSLCTVSRISSPANSNFARPQDFGVGWLPLFFSVCLFYMPKRVSATSRIILVCSLILLVSGLLPGDGFLYLFGMVQYCLFIAISIGLIVDFIPQPANGAIQAAGHGVRS
jgi:hypothetical protein